MPESNAVTDASKPIVLIIDDDEDCRHMYGMALEHAGLRVVTANNGLEGVRLARLHEPDVILMDIAMPVMDGKTAARMLKANRATADLPILAVTARSFTTESSTSQRSEFEDVFIKPTAPADLVAAVQRLIDLNRPTSSRSP
jgi:CheY-like chemotaxis protein